MTLGEALSKIRQRISSRKSTCDCVHCRRVHEGFEMFKRPAPAVEVYVACESCGNTAQTFNGLQCGMCGTEVADKTRERLYDGAS